jgi:two-component system, NarL family, response regulator
MVVDDHFIVRIGLAATINVEPDMLVVAEAGDGLQSIAKFREHTPDITLMDLRLPGMSGVEAIEAIRRDFAQARIIVLSTYDGDEAIARALRAGAQAYLLKTALHDELLNAIRAVHAGKKHIPTEIAARLAQRLPDSELSSREIEVLKLIAKGMSNKEVAGVLFITEGTVKFHVLNILNKLNANDRTMAVTIALQRGIIFL